MPSRIPPDQPLYLNQATRRRIRREFEPIGIFLNIPYSKRYSNLEVAINSTVTAYSLNPRMARERARTEVRLLKIMELILACEYGLTDLSYVNRMNMPLELGLHMAFGKETFIASRRRYAALRTISDFEFLRYPLPRRACPQAHIGAFPMDRTELFRPAAHHRDAAPTLPTPPAAPTDPRG